MIVHIGAALFLWPEGLRKIAQVVSSLSALAISLNWIISIPFLEWSSKAWRLQPDSGGRYFDSYLIEVRGLDDLRNDDHVEVGMSPMKAIVSATSDSARSCWADTAVGSLEPGKQADVLVVDGDPSKDIQAAKNVEAVFLGGALVDREDYV